MLWSGSLLDTIIIKMLNSDLILFYFMIMVGPCLLSSPRAKRAGPKGLRAESARAFTGRRLSHSGRGEDFLTGQPDFFTERAVAPPQKVEKSFPRWEINRNAEG